MKFFEKLAGKVTKTASEAVKTEVRKTAIDHLPAIIGVAGTIAGFLIFRKSSIIRSEAVKPTVSRISITTNNYFLGEANREAMKKILEG